MHIHQAVYERISNSISGSIFVCIFNSISCCIFRAHTHDDGVVTVASPWHLPAPARGLCPFAARSQPGRYGKFVARQRKHRQIAIFNQIRSARLNSGSQWRLVCNGTSAPRGRALPDIRHLGRTLFIATLQGLYRRNPSGLAQVVIPAPGRA